MAAALASFKAKATGPARLRASLRRRVAPLGTLLQSLDAPRAVRAEVARGVLGGDIFSVMSARLRRLLEHAEPPAALPDQTRTRHAMAQQSPGPNQASPPRAPFVRPARPTGPPHAPTANSSTDSARRTPPGWPPAARNVNTQALAPLTHDAKKHSPRASASEARTFADARPQSPLPPDDVPAPARGRVTPDGVLVVKLREYWQAVERAQSNVDASPPSAAPATGRIEGARQLPAPAAAPQRRWPEVTGQQFARKLGAAFDAGAPNSFKRVQQTVHTDPPERVEIQNIFNVEVRADDAMSFGPSADLSESIADILREQAIQHGIDLT
jgi:hypothetical protein